MTENLKASPLRLLFFVLVLAASLRVAAVVIFANRDEVLFEYMLIARNLLNGFGFSWDDTTYMPLQPTTLFPPLYVYWCAFFMAWSPLNFLPLYLGQALVGATGVIPAFLAGRDLFSQNTGLVLAALYAVFPEFIYLPARPVPEFLYVVVFLWLLVIYLRLKSALVAGRAALPMAALLGSIAGLGMLIRASALVQLGAIMLSLGWSLRRRLSKLLPAAALITGFAAIMLLPWAIRNYNVQQRLIPLRTGLGLNLWIGNNPFSVGTPRTLNGAKVRFNLPPDEIQRMKTEMPDDELERDAYYKAEAIRFIRGNPFRYAALCRNRLQFFVWFDSTHHLASHPVYRISYILLLLLAIPGLIIAIRHRRLDLVLPLTYISYLLFYVPILMLPRYRIIPVVILTFFAAYSVNVYLASRTARKTLK